MLEQVLSMTNLSTSSLFLGVLSILAGSYFRSGNEFKMIAASAGILSPY